MVLITQPHSLPVNEYSSYDSIILLAHAEEAIPVETVKTLLESGSDVSVTILPKQADDMELAFSIGSIVGMHGGPENVSISLESTSVKDMMKRMGMGDALFTPPKKTAGRRKVSGTSGTGTKKTAASGKKPAERRPALENAPAGKQKSTPASKKLPPAFLKGLKTYGVDSAYADRIVRALQDSAEPVSYEIRLQLNMMDRNVSADVYAKTKDHYQELKGLIAGL